MPTFEQAGLYNLKHINQSRKHKQKKEKKSRNKRLEKMAFSFDSVYHYPFKTAKDLYHVVYIIQHVNSGCFYIGVHSDTDHASVLKTYFTSSTVVKSILSVDGDESFVIKQLFFLPNRMVAEELESILIRMNAPSNNPYILNKAFVFEGKTFVSKWNVADYRGELIAVNPKCAILSESTDEVGIMRYVLPYEITHRTNHTPTLKPQTRLLSLHGPEKKVHRISSTELKHLQ